MGYYIQTENFVNKAQEIVARHKATVLPNASIAKEAFREGFGIVCVVQNGAFDAAGYCFSEDEIDAFNQPHDHRPKTWLSMNKNLAQHLSGYNR